MSDSDRFIRAIELVESAGQGNAGLLGDDGRARGRYQMHPAFFSRFAGRGRLGDTWDMYDAQTMQAFAAWWAREEHVVVWLDAALYYHYGHVPDGDPHGYAAKFRAAWAATMEEE